MKERLSVMMLAARSTVYRVIALILATAAVQAGLYYGWLVNSISPDSSWLVNLEIGMSDSGIMLAAAVSFILLCVILCMTGLGPGAKSLYTLRRLAISEKEILCWLAVYNTLVFLLFWMSQILTVMGLCRMYEWLAPILCEKNGVPVSELLMGPQTVYIAFYRDKYMHSLLPMAEISRWIRNLVLLLSLGVCTTTFGNSLRYGKKAFALLVVMVVTLGMFCGGVGAIELDIISGLIALTAGVSSAWYALGGAEDEA